MPCPAGTAGESTGLGSVEDCGQLTEGTACAGSGYCLSEPCEVRAMAASHHADSSICFKSRCGSSFVSRPITVFLIHAGRILLPRRLNVTEGAPVWGSTRVLPRRVVLADACQRGILHDQRPHTRRYQQRGRWGPETTSAMPYSRHGFARLNSQIELFICVL